MVSLFFPAADIGMKASSAATAAAVFLGTVILQAEMKTVPTTMTMMTMNERPHRARARAMRARKLSLSSEAALGKSQQWSCSNGCQCWWL